MKGSKSRFMNRLLLIQSVLFLCNAAVMHAQTGQLSRGGTDPVEWYHEFDRTRRSNLWNDGRNTAGMRQDTISVSSAGVLAEYAGGGFRDSNAASSSWKAGVQARTVTHMKRTSLAGSFFFENFSGYGMCGSMSARPGYYPFDVMEFTPGTKTRQTYSFSGGISSDIGRHWRIGGSIDYTGMNYTKRKDLRHSNYLLDMTVIPSVMYYCEDFALGVSAIFSKNSETVNAEKLGISSSTYYAFLDKGLMYGAYESWEGSGVHLSESGINGFPARELLFGGAVQAQWKSLYAEAEYLYGSGKAGEKQTVWFRFPSHRTAVRLGYVSGNDITRHYIRLNIGWMLQYNNESVMQKVTENGVTVTMVYGYNRIFSRSTLSLSPEYEFAGKTYGCKAGVAINSYNRQASQIFPYIVFRNDLLMEAYLSGYISLRRFDFMAGLSFRTGNWREQEKTSETSADPGDPPYRMENLYGVQSEYLTASRITTVIGIRYRFRKGLYTEAAGQYMHGFGLKNITGSGRYAGTIRIGFEF